MQHRAPIDRLPTHEVTNMPPPIGDQDLWAQDRALQHWARVFQADSAAEHLARLGAAAGRAETFDKATAANRFTPELQAFDRYGQRVNAVSFHPAYHDLLGMAVQHEVHAYAWNHPGAGAQAAHAALTYMFTQPEGGVMCPMAMTYAAIPALAHDPTLAAEWVPRLTSNTYDPRDIPVAEKTGAQMGMFMTEKQGGSDVRTNATTARPEGAATGPGAGYLLTGHKWFCSAPMCDAFLVLANTEVGISCFLVPRWRPDGTRNALMLQRLKDKLGNRSNASSEMEFLDTFGVMLGEEGRGIRVIIDMVTGNRMYCAASSAGLMRQALVQAIHHATHRSAFQRRLIDQPLMQNVLADMAVEVEAALALALRVAREMDKGQDAPFARIGCAVAKYWVCKRAPAMIFEAMECHGGPGYIEDTILPRLYREAPVNSIWEGSGNVMCLDVLRALAREPESREALMAELGAARGLDGRLDAEMAALSADLGNPERMEFRARAITERMARCLQGALLFRHGEEHVAEAFAATRLGPGYAGAFGTLPDHVRAEEIIARAAV